MTSKLAKQQIEQWWKEGLKPTFEDIIKLNALGLKVERGSEVYNFAACPRVAFLGDWTLFEPTVGKRIWMDTAKQLLRDDYQTHLYFTVWALNCPDAELPKATNTADIINEVKEFAQNVLIDFTETQMLAAIDYVMNGRDPTTDENFSPEKNEVYEVPDEVMSNAKQLLCEALLCGVDSDVKNYVTIPQLERMIIVAALNKGADILKNEHTQDAARFYACVGVINKRLIEEREKENGKV